MTGESKTEDERASRARNLAGLWIALLVVVVGAGIWWLSGDAQRHAQDVCTDAVKGKVTSPATAQVTYTVVRHDGDAWSLAGTVDADRRHGFECTVGPQDAVTATIG